MIKTIENKSAEEIKQLFMELIDFYTTPSFGAVRQREFDIFLYGKLQELGIFDNNDDIYEVVSKLKITRSKARNLIYENNLRNSTIEILDNQLKKELENARLLKSNTYLVSMEIENPLLIDHLKAKLKTNGYSSDGSFSPDIVKLSSDALISVIESYMDLDTEKEIMDQLTKLGYVTDKSFKACLTKFFSHVAKKFAGEAGDVIIGEYIAPFLKGSIDNVTTIVKPFIQKKSN